MSKRGKRKRAKEKACLTNDACHNTSNLIGDIKNMSH